MLKIPLYDEALSNIYTESTHQSSVQQSSSMKYLHTSQDKALRHRRLKALPNSKSLVFHQLKYYGSMITQPEDINSRDHDKVHMRLLTMDDEPQHDDSMDLAARLIPPEDLRATSTFQGIYKRIQEIDEKKKYYMSPHKTIYTAMAQQVHKSSLFPRKLGLIRSDRKMNEVNASNYSIGDHYAKVLAAGLASDPMQNISAVSLKNNRLTANGVSKVMKNLSSKVQSLNLQGNKIGQLHKPNSLSRRFNLSNLQELNLENNRICDDSARDLFHQLSENKTIRSLNLSRNCISDNSANELYQLLINNKSIVEVYLHWNWLHSMGGKAIANALYHNDTLRILDLSFNSLGVSGDKIPCSSVWADYLQSEQCILVHLDMSSNQFTVEDMKVIGAALEKNHVTYGIHFRGNADSTLTIDYRGFLTCGIQTVENQGNFLVQENNKTAEDDFLPGIFNHRRIDGCKSLPKNPQQSENCWICDGFVEQTFIWSPTALEIHTDPIFIHLSHERYVPVQMKLVDSTSKVGVSPMTRKNKVRDIWMVKRMIPSNVDIKYFFSSPLIKQCGYSRNQPKIDWQEDEWKKKVVFYTQNGDMFKFRRAKMANIINVHPQPIFKDKWYSSPLIESLPRTKDLGGILNHQLEEIQQFDENIDEDFFRDCQRDSDETYAKCFEADWNKSFIPKILRSPQEIYDVKEYLRSIYRDIVSAYRSYSAISPNGDLWCITLNVYTDLFAPVTVETMKYGLKDLDLMYKQVTSKHAASTRVQTQLALIRFQFMEVIVRLALDKYSKSGFSAIESIQRLYEQDGLSNKIESILDPQEWRDLYYWTKLCNKVAIQQTKPLEQLFSQAVSFRQLNYFTTLKFVTPSAFRELFTRAGLIDDNNVERSLNQAYNQSVQLVVDEVSSDRAMQMNFKEFVEALCRVAEKMNMQVSGENRQELVANKFSSLIQTLIKRYQIITDEEKNRQRSTAIEQQQQKESKVRQSFVQRNANRIVYEADETPVFSLKPNKITTNFGFSSAIEELNELN